ncbi:hypothetical protein CIK66_17705 [Brachybacterium alimentarium]|uniref:Uncharacterized protein n=1 Tax=Brachybacterium alimentarium TaxID=47845 RepID=A0A2A3YEL9_9MICO|nr:hypothetical protein CIK66_17705 [Brachybacterium alimentarium]
MSPVTPSVLRIIEGAIAATRVDISEEEAVALWPKIQQWAKVNARRPDRGSDDPTEKHYAEVLLFLQRRKEQREAQRRAETMEVAE